MNNHRAPVPARPIQTTTDIFNQTTSIFSTRKNHHIFVLLSFIFFNLLFGIDLTTQALTSYIDNQPAIKAFYSPISKSTPPSLADPQSNDTFNPQFDNEIRASNSNFTFVTIQNDSVSDQINDSVSTDDSTEALFAFIVFFGSYCFLMSGFLLIQSYVQRVIFELVLNQFCGRHNSIAMVFKNDFRFIRSFDIIVMRWIVRCVITLILCQWFFGGIKDRYSGFKIFNREILMPYSIFTPLVKGYEVETQGFILPWLIVDFFISFLTTLYHWIVMGDPGKNNIQVVKEGWHLLWLKFLPGFILKCYESLLCGPFGRWVLARIFGELFAIAFQAFMEVYFMVAWLVYYVGVKSIDAKSRGQPFGQPQLQAMLVVDDQMVHNS